MHRQRQLAQANVARPRAPLGSPVMGEFALALDPVYRIAEQSPGFVWRLVSGERHGVTVVEDGVPLTVNLSVWESYAALRRLRYLRAHGPSPRAFTLLRRFGPDGRPEPRRGRRR